MNKILVVAKVCKIISSEKSASNGVDWNLRNMTEAEIQVSHWIRQNFSIRRTWRVLVAEVHSEGHRPLLQLFQVMEQNISIPFWQWNPIQLSPARANDLLNELRRLSVVRPPACVRNSRTHIVCPDEITLIK